ncbi:MAG: hypothetical protein ACR2GA_02910 [Chloroflexota bacterium]
MHPEKFVTDLLNGQITRSQLLKAAAVGSVAAAVPSVVGAASPTLSFPFFPQTPGSYSPETVEQITGSILTWAYFETTASTFILTTPPLLAQLGLTGVPLAFLQAFAAEQQAQLDFWSSLVPEAKPQTTTFTVNPALIPNPLAGLQIFEVLASIRTGLALTAVREFAELGQPTLAKYAAQYSSVQIEERVIVRLFQALAGNSAAIPPNNKAFATDLFLYTRDAVGAMFALGLIGGKGVTLTYPGRAAVLAAAGPIGAGILQQTPNNASTSVAITGPASFLSPRP